MIDILTTARYNDSVRSPIGQEGGEMTCIIGMYCNAGKSAVIIADSRTMRGGDYYRDRKIFKIGDDIVFASAGYTGIEEKLLSNVGTARLRSRQIFPSEIVNIFEDEMAELYNRYKMTRPFRFSSDDILINGCIAFIDDGKPKLYCLHENGFAEAIRDFRAIGHGARHALNILRTLYHPATSLERAIEIGVYALIEVSKIDAMVDSCPQIAVLEMKDGKPNLNIWNIPKSGDFIFECKQIEDIKNKLNGIEDKRTKVFHLLLDGTDEIKGKLDLTLEGYENERSGANRKGASKTRGKGEVSK